MIDLFIINMWLFTSQDINLWSLVDYWDVFISCLDSHSDGTHSLQRIRWWACAKNVMQNLSKSVTMNKKMIIHVLVGLRAIIQI